MVRDLGNRGRDRSRFRRGVGRPAGQVCRNAARKAASDARRQRVRSLDAEVVDQLYGQRATVVAMSSGRTEAVGNLYFVASDVTSARYGGLLK